MQPFVFPEPAAMVKVSRLTLVSVKFPLRRVLTLSGRDLSPMIWSLDFGSLAVSGSYSDAASHQLLASQPMQNNKPCFSHAAAFVAFGRKARSWRLATVYYDTSIPLSSLSS